MKTWTLFFISLCISVVCFPPLSFQPQVQSKIPVNKLFRKISVISGFRIQSDRIIIVVYKVWFREIRSKERTFSLDLALRLSLFFIWHMVSVVHGYVMTHLQLCPVASLEEPTFLFAWLFAFSKVVYTANTGQCRT